MTEEPNQQGSPEPEPAPKDPTPKEPKPTLDKLDGYFERSLDHEQDAERR